MTDIREIIVTCPICDGTHTGDPYDSHDVRGLMCQRRDCRETIRFPVTVQGLGCFCSSQCADMEAGYRGEKRTA